MANEILNSKVTLSICLDARKERILGNGTMQIRHRITHTGIRKYLPTGIFISEKDFETMFNPTKRKADSLHEIKTKLEKRQEDIIEVLNKYFPEYYNHSEFDEKLKEHDNLKTGTRKKTDRNVYSHLNQKINELKENNQFGSAELYTNTLKSLESFHNKKTVLNFEDITVDFLNKYKNDMLKNGKSLTTIGIYLRNLRCIFNNAKEQESEIGNVFYPFGSAKDLFTIPTKENNKTALNIIEIGKIMNYETNELSEAKARDFFIFSYLCNGINMADIARLKFNQYNNDRIVFYRTKTIKTTENSQKEIQIQLTNEIKPIIDNIIEKWGQPKKPENYIFGIINDSLNEEKKRNTVKQATKLTNKYIRRIAVKIGLDKDITTYIARCIFRTKLTPIPV